MLEREYQRSLIKELKNRFPGAVILKNDPNYLQGIPDLTMLWENKWAVLEDKAHRRARHRPNQDYYVEMLNEMSFAAFIYPENEEEVLHDLQLAFQPRRHSRFS